MIISIDLVIWTLFLFCKKNKVYLKLKKFSINYSQCVYLNSNDCYCVFIDYKTYTISILISSKQWFLNNWKSFLFAFQMGLLLYLTNVCYSFHYKSYKSLEPTYYLHSNFVSFFLNSTWKCVRMPLKVEYLPQTKKMH